MLLYSVVNSNKHIILQKEEVRRVERTYIICNGPISQCSYDSFIDNSGYRSRYILCKFDGWLNYYALLEKSPV